MKIEQFQLERLMSEWQNEVQIDLSASGVDSLHLHEFITHDEFERIYRETKIRYVQTNGPVPLRQAIAQRYIGAKIENVFATNGSSEALTILIWMFGETDFEIVEIAPTYTLVAGLGRTFSATVKTVPLQPDQEWALDVEALENTVTATTKMIYCCNPNNPTGSIFTEAEMEAIIQAAARVGAWIVADEIYHGAELDGVPTNSFWGTYDKVIITSSLSKAYGLAGLRLGWLVAPPELIAKVWRYHDYTTITTTVLSAKLACLALEPEREKRIFARTRQISQEQFKVLYDWIAQRSTLVSGTPTRIGGLAFVRYHLDADSESLTKRLIHEEGLLLGPGAFFGQEYFLRIGYSVPHLQAGLERLGMALDRLSSQV
jgi:aspartate/methionine/tyrosine aminotransferase